MSRGAKATRGINKEEQGNGVEVIMLNAYIVSR
jgi:hypothetical protein